MPRTSTTLIIFGLNSPIHHLVVLIQQLAILYSPFSITMLCISLHSFQWSGSCQPLALELRYDTKNKAYEFRCVFFVDFIHRNFNLCRWTFRWDIWTTGSRSGRLIQMPTGSLYSTQTSWYVRPLPVSWLWTSSSPVFFQLLHAAHVLPCFIIYYGKNHGRIYPAGLPDMYWTKVGLLQYSARRS